MNQSPAQTQATALREIKTLAREHRWGEATALIKNLLAQDPGDPKLLYWQGVVRFQTNDPVGAVTAFRSAERSGLNTESLHKSLGLAYWKMHQYTLFEKQMNKAIDLDPSDYEPYYALGRHYQSIKDDCTRSMEFLEKGIKLKPDDARIIFSRGVCQEMLGRRDDAKSSYVEAMRLVDAKHEKYSWPFQEMARLLLGQDSQQALKLAQKAVELQPDSNSAHEILAKVEDALGMYSEAIEELLTATRLDPSNASPHYSLFIIYKKVNNLEAARGQLTQFQELKALYEQR